MIHIIGIGSPHGDDQIAWMAAEALRHSTLITGLGGQVVITLADRPGPQLLNDLRGARAAILIDAVRSGAPAGTVHRLDPDQLPAWTGSLMSSHGIGLAQTLALGQALRLLPPVVIVLGVEIVQVDPSQPPSAAVCAAVPDVAQWVERELRRLV